MSTAVWRKYKWLGPEKTLVTLFATVPFLALIDSGAAPVFLRAEGIWLTLSAFAFMLFRRIWAATTRLQLVTQARPLANQLVVDSDRSGQISNVRFRGYTSTENRPNANG